MAKTKTVFICTECGYESPRWLGQCSACGEWNTMEEQTVTPAAAKAKNAARSLIMTSEAVMLGDVSSDERMRLKTGINELDRVLGGGIVNGSAVLIGGDPGIGKSTLLLQMCSSIADEKRVLYVSGEESARQIKLRAQRLSCNMGIALLCETDLMTIIGKIESFKPDVVIVDSVQTMTSAELTSAPGSVSQVREATQLLTRTAKLSSSAIFLVGHVTKEGAIAGPRVLEHLVDTVLYFESDGDVFRVLRAVKNRFGSTNEIGVFEMRDDGMKEVPNPSSLFLSEWEKDVSGCAVLCAIEGSRPVLAEVQSLVSYSPFGNPKRMAAGVDYNRMVLLCAVLEKKGGLKLCDKDVYVNIVGGFKPEERACDLAVLMAIASSFTDLSVRPSTVFIGEAGLTGEVRSVTSAQRRVQECKKLGFERVVLPAANAKAVKVSGIELVGVRNISQAMSAGLTAKK